jgi:hypothetical protein
MHDASGFKFGLQGVLDLPVYRDRKLVLYIRPILAMNDTAEMTKIDSECPLSITLQR